MKIDITSMFFNSRVIGTATAAWRTSIGQNNTKQCRIEADVPGVTDIVVGMMHLLKGDFSTMSHMTRGGNNDELLISSVFEKVYINGNLLKDCKYVLSIVREHTASHEGRKELCYSPNLCYGDDIANSEAIKKMASALGCTEDGCWFVYDISVKNQDELHFSAIVVDPESPAVYDCSGAERTNIWNAMVAERTGVEIPSPTFVSDKPLQQIYYGAPGTGKSHGIKKQEDLFAEVIRTTFHPDSDYSTFVGCYKPKMASAERIYNHGELINLLSKIKLTGTSYPCQKWASRYWESIKSMSTDDIKSILSACGFTDSMTTEVSKSIAVGEEFASNGTTNQITYAFTPQAFTQAYLEAWRKFEKNEPVLLVIEEINRGNCAQIFGDLFQLLDRNKEGYSTYPIIPDTDLGSYIGKQGLNVHNAILKKDDGTAEDISEVINSGKKLVLPPNLFIWATMNTSDQSLFPIDSAFKRRWDWKYVRIEYKNTEWKIEIGGLKYDWVAFQRVINKKIYEATESEDKQLGDWFVKAENDTVTADVLLNKIIFYLWNDVCKSGDGDIFKINTDPDYTKDPDPQKNVDITFSQFFDDRERGTKLQQWMHYLGIKPDAES